MKVYVGQTRAADLIRELKGYGWGEMTQPKELPARRAPFALDNYAFACFKANRPWDAVAFKRALEWCEEHRRYPEFVVAPDVVGAGVASLTQSLAWGPWLRQAFRWPVYLPVQEGMTLDIVAGHLQQFDGLFVGGASHEWKLKSAYWWTRLAHSVGKPCHVGRVSGRERVRLVKAYGVDSIDSCVPLWSEENRQAVLKGLADPAPEFDPPDPEQFLTGWERL